MTLLQIKILISVNSRNKKDFHIKCVRYNLKCSLGRLAPMVRQLLPPNCKAKEMFVESPCYRYTKE